MSKMTLSVGIQDLKMGSRLGDIAVPEQLRTRHKTGIVWFDEALGGEGFAPSSVMMLTGTPGAGKSTMLLQLADAITKAGHVCLYNTGEESLYQTKMVAERLKLTSNFIVGQDTTVEGLLAHADHLRAANPKRQIFILQDSLQTLDDDVAVGRGGANSLTPVRATEALVNWAKANFGIVIFIGQVKKDGEFAGKNTILHAIDLRGQIYIDKSKKSETYGERIFEVTKNRYGVSGRSFIVGINSRGLYSKGEL